MHEINIDYCKVVVEDRRRMATEFFHKQHLARLQRQERPSSELKRHTELRIGVNISVIWRLIRAVSRITKRRAGLHAAE